MLLVDCMPTIKTIIIVLYFLNIFLEHCAAAPQTIIDSYNVPKQNHPQKRPTMEEYLVARDALVKKQYASSFENDVILNDREVLANEIIMRLKKKAIQQGLDDPSTFTPSRHIFNVMDQMEAAPLFKIIQKMPKGGVLHAHDTALCGSDYIVNITYREHLWQCTDNRTDDIVEFKFSIENPASLSISSSSDQSCNWVLVSDARKLIGAKRYDEYVRSLFTLYTETPQTDYKDINVIWSKFQDIFDLLLPIVTYGPVWKEYFKQALRELYNDGVQYLEFRGVLPEVYELDGKIYSASEVVQIYIDAINEYKEENSNFIGAKLIYAPWRRVSNHTIEKYIKTIIELNAKYPDFVVGFDFVGQEDLGRRLFDFVPYVLQLPPHINGFFHAGETNWFGETDENLIDAILLGAKRIGHGFALAKHPTLLQMVKDKGIVVEINPVSNQVLKLVDDYRNHPASLFFAANIPLVVSSDDYSFWETLPLSHDFYQAFLGIASSHSDLRTLKKLATNSIKYSSMSDDEKKQALKMWQPKWNQFIEDVIVGF